MLDGVLFDMDGVLCDSERFMTEAAMAMFRNDFQLEVAEEDFRPFVGTGEDSYLGGVAEKHGIALDLPDHKLRAYSLYLDAIKGQLQPLPGALHFVQRLQEVGRQVAVASSADRIKVMGSLAEIGLDPDSLAAVVTGDDIARKKPDPEIYRSAAAALGLEPGACLVVEDAISGVRAGKAAGCRVLGVCNSFPADDLQEAGADWCTASLETLPGDCLRELGLD
ncbi:MAG: HAD family hydrolase [Planctomycetota bacterium]